MCIFKIEEKKEAVSRKTLKFTFYFSIIWSILFKFFSIHPTICRCFNLKSPIFQIPLHGNNSTLTQAEMFLIYNHTQNKAMVIPKIPFVSIFFCSWFFLLLYIYIYIYINEESRTTTKKILYIYIYIYLLWAIEPTSLFDFLPPPSPHLSPGISCVIFLLLEKELSWFSSLLQSRSDHFIHVQIL